MQNVMREQTVLLQSSIRAYNSDGTYVDEWETAAQFPNSTVRELTDGLIEVGITYASKIGVGGRIVHVGIAYRVQSVVNWLQRDERWILTCVPVTGDT